MPRMSGPRPVFGLRRNDPTNPAARFRNVASIAWDHVQMRVVDRLSRDLAHVHAEVVATGLELPVEQFSDGREQAPDRQPLIGRQPEEIGFVPLRDDQDVPGAERETVEERRGRLVFAQEITATDPLAEDAAHGTETISLRARRDTPCDEISGSPGW